MSRIFPLLIAALSLGACSDPPTLNGKVVDVWGKAVPDATVRLDGVPDSATSDAEGGFSFEKIDGQIRFMAGKEGYIENTYKALPPADPEAAVPEAVIRLYPDPGSLGFHAVGLSGYEGIGSVNLKTKGTDLGAYTGLPTDPPAVTGGGKEFLFSSEASPSELSRLNLQLHKLEFKQSATVQNVTGDVEVKIDLFVATDSVPFELTVLPKENFYLIVPSEELSGEYAFHTQGVLTSTDSDALAKLPQELQIAYPFKVK